MKRRAYSLKRSAERTPCKSSSRCRYRQRTPPKTCDARSKTSLRHSPRRGPSDIIHAEGPRRYSANDVAAALGQLSGRTIHAQAVPRSQWKGALERMPASVAELLIKANDAKNKGGLVDVEPNAGEVVHGATELIDSLRPLLPVSPRDRASD